MTKLEQLQKQFEDAKGDQQKRAALAKAILKEIEREAKEKKQNGKETPSPHW